MIHDCLIIGGGVAGSSAAFTLARAGLRVAAIDRRAGRAGQKIGECLSGQGVHLLKRSGLLPWARKSRPIENTGDMSSWGSEMLIEKDFIFDLFGSGWHLDRAAFDGCLQAAARSAGAGFIEGTVRGVSRTARSGWKVRLAEGDLHAKWIVDAGGRYGVASRHLGIARRTDSPLVAVFSWGPNRSPESRTLVEAAPEGWWYTARLPGNRRVAALHTGPAHAKRLIHDARLFAAAMRRTLHVSRHCSFDASWERLRGADASGSALTATAGEDWLAVGDAAMTFEPLSAHGMTNALAHGIFGAAAIVKSFSADFGALETISQEARKKREKYLMDIKKIYRDENRWNNSFWSMKNAEDQFDA